MLGVKLQGLDNGRESFSLLDEFFAELRPAISHRLLQPTRCAFMDFSHVLELSHSGLKVNLEDSVINQDFSRYLWGNLYNIAHVHLPGGDLFAQTERPAERKKGGEGLLDNLCLSFLDPLRQHYLIVTAQEVLREEAGCSRVTRNFVVHQCSISIFIDATLRE